MGWRGTPKQSLTYSVLRTRIGSITARSIRLRNGPEKSKRLAWLDFPDCTAEFQNDCCSIVLLHSTVSVAGLGRAGRMDSAAGGLQ